MGLWDDKPTREKAEGAVYYLREALKANPTTHKALLYLPQMETEAEYPGCVAAARWVSTQAKDVQTIIITNLLNERANPQLAKDLARLNVWAMPEVYACENMAWTNDPLGFERAMAADALRLGYRDLILLLGVYWDYGFAKYEPKNLPASWNYLAETMTDRTGDWDIVFS